METIIEALQKNSNIKTHLIKRDISEASSAHPAATWSIIEQVSLAGQGKGKAIISFSATTGNNKDTMLGANITANGISQSDEITRNATITDWISISSSAIIEYDENTQIIFKIITINSFKARYGYSILLIPEEE